MTDEAKMLCERLRIGDQVRVKRNLSKPWTFDWDEREEHSVVGLVLLSIAACDAPPSASAQQPRSEQAGRGQTQGDIRNG